MKRIKSAQSLSCSLPIISVAMPVYNGREYLRLAVLSVIKQTFQDWELLIIDDGSTDDSISSISDILDPRIRVFRDGINKGLSVRLNEAIDLAKGRYFARMDQDDVSYPERLFSQVDILKTKPLIDLVSVRSIKIDEENLFTGVFPYALNHDGICKSPWSGFYFPHPTWVGRIEWFRKYGYKIPGPYFSEDQELLLRSYNQSNFYTVDEILFAYRIRSKLKLGKLIKTRATMFKFQFIHFIKLKKFNLMIMSFLIFLVKLSLDFFKKIKMVFFYEHPKLDDQVEKRRWEEVLNFILEK